MTGYLGSTRRVCFLGLVKQKRSSFPGKMCRNDPFFGQLFGTKKCGFKLTEIKFGACSRGIQSACQSMIGVYNHLLSKVFRFHYHSQKVIGSLGFFRLVVLVYQNNKYVSKCSLGSSKPRTIFGGTKLLVLGSSSKLSFFQYPLILRQINPMDPSSCSDCT